jgi:hypothetical protein
MRGGRVRGDDMSPTNTHAHIDRPSDAQLKEAVKGKPAEIRQLYLHAHRLVLDTLPDLVYSVDCDDGQIGYGMKQYGYNGWGLAALAPHTKWISLGFLRGTALDDPDRLLEGTGSSVRHIKLRSLEQLTERRTAIRRLLEAATRVKPK